jgi:hypothetical protein
LHKNVDNVGLKGIQYLDIVVYPFTAINNVRAAQLATRQHTTSFLSANPTTNSS